MNAPDLEAVVQALDACNGNKTQAAAMLGVNRSTFRHWLGKATAAELKRQIPRRSTLEVLTPPDALLPVEELVARRKRQYERKHRAEEARKLIPVKVSDRKPIGLVVIGDPHVDDDGTDIVRLERDALLIANTDGLHGINIGDTSNNWVGRLARLYGEQSTSAAEAWQLAEWFLRLVPWLAVIGGNHDVWSGAGDPIKWIVDRALYEPAAVRLGLKFPNGRELRVNARHDFAGASQWNPAHGPMKATQLGWRDHVLVAGHKHQSGYGVLKCPATGLVSHAIRVASYKVHDRYAKQLGLPDQNIAPAVCCVIRPDADEVGLVTVFHDLEAAADFVTWLRRRK